MKWVKDITLTDWPREANALPELRRNVNREIMSCFGMKAK